MKLTAKTIDTVQLPAGKFEVIVYDDEIPGFGARIRVGGSRTFIYQYKIGTKTRRLTLGTAVKEAFPDIRKRVLDLQAQVRLGNDPAGAKEEKRREADQTFDKLAELFIAKAATRLAPRTLDELRRFLTVLAKPLHGKTLASITRRDVALALSQAAAGVSKGTGQATSNRLRSAISSFFAWAMTQGLVEANPVIGTEKHEERSRDRVLTDAELAEIWNALDGTAFCDIVRLLMLTGQRRSEMGGLRWSEVDLEESRITLPKTRTKNGIEHVIPLSDPARDILTRQYRIVGRDTVFGRGENGVSGWYEGKGALDGRLPPDMPHWTLHDIRRSVATGMARLGVQPHIIEAVLNHISGHKAGVAGIYNRNTYEPEKRAALTLWAEHLMAVVSGKAAKVVPFKVA